MRLKNFLFILLAAFVFSSCSSDSYTVREKALFTTPIFGHDVPLDSISTLGDLVVYFDHLYCGAQAEDKWPILYFDLKEKKLVNPQEGRDILAMGIEPSPCSNVMFKYDFTRILEVVKDGYNLEVEGQRIEPDSLTAFIALQYLNYGENPLYSTDPKSNGIWLITNKDDKMSNLNNYISQIIGGYIQMAKKYSELQFHKSLESLSDQEFDELRKVLSFHLSFKYSDEAPQIINTLM